MPKPAAKTAAKKTAAKKTAAKKTAVKKLAAKKTAAKKAVSKASTKKSPTKKPLVKKAPAKTASAPRARKPAARTDYGKRVDSFFARQPARLRPITDALRGLVASAAPDAVSSIKWGMPFYEIEGSSMCAIGAHKTHVNLILSGPPSAFVDPDRRLSGEGRMGRHLKVTSVDDIPRTQVTTWLRRAAEVARSR